MKDVDEQYRTDANLRARVETHQRYTVGPELEPAVDARLSLDGGESLLDVGTGYGDFPARLRAANHNGRLVGLDQQAGMIDHARRRHADITFIRGDVEQLPFDDASFDVITSRHMLYHVPDIGRALREMHRVLRVGGRFLAVTNTRDTMAAFWSVIADAAKHDASLQALNRGSVGLRFADHNAEPFIREAFGNVIVTRLDARLEFPSPEPVERYFRSCLDGSEVADRDAATTHFRNALLTRWPASGPWIVSKAILFLTARKVSSPRQQMSTIP